MKKIILIVLFLLMPFNSYSYPLNDIQIKMRPYWQNVEPYRGVILGCKYDDTSCKSRRSGKTMGGYGCALTSLAMLYWAYGFYWIPDSDHHPKYSVIDTLNLKNFNDYASQNIRYSLTYGGRTAGFDGSYGIDWTKFTSNYYYYNSIERTNIGIYYSYLIPNYDCGLDNDYRMGRCFIPEWSDINDVTNTSMKLLDEDLYGYRPAIMRFSWYDLRTTRVVYHDTHFVVIAGYEKDFNRQDDVGWYRAHNPMFVDNEDNIPKPLNGITQYGRMSGDRHDFRIGDIARIYRFKGKQTDKLLNTSRINIDIHSPVDVQVIDPLGYVSGYSDNNDMHTDENPMAIYYNESSIGSIYGNDDNDEIFKRFTLVELVEGNYIIKLIGTGEGPYTVDMEWTKNDGTPNLVRQFVGTATPSMSETYRIKYSPTGEATLSQTNEPPNADAGSNQTGEQSYEITLDASTSHDPDGDPLKYNWSFASKPDGSAATLSDPSAIAPTFTPDKPGIYVLQLVVNDYFTDSDPVTVTVTATPVKSRIAVTPNFSQPLSVGSSAISFDINNIGRVGVSSGVIDLRLKDPDGAMISAGSQAFSAAVGQSTTVSAPVTISPLKFGNYSLTYTVADETGTGYPTTVTVANSATASFSFDKVMYRVRDTANLTLNVANTGKFKLDSVVVTVSVPDTGYAESKTIDLTMPAEPGQLTYVVPIPETTLAGQHEVKADLSLPAGRSIIQIGRFALQESALTLSLLDSAQYSAGDTLTLFIENQGSVDASYTTDSLTLADNKGDLIYQGNVVGTVMAGVKKTFATIQIPAQTTSGMVFLKVELRDTLTDKISYFSKPVSINSMVASLLVRTDQEVYQSTERITAITTVESSALKIDNGTLNLKVNRIKRPTGGEFVQFLPLTGGGSCSNSQGEFCDPRGIAVSKDGSIFVADSRNDRIEIFDSNGNFIRKFGAYGSNNGQFYYPTAVAAAADGSVYVVDTLNHRIQKFDSDGTFLLSWGGYGRSWSSDGGNNASLGKFNLPSGVAVGPDGAVYVADRANYRIQKFDSQGKFIAKFGSLAQGYSCEDGKFTQPFGVAVNLDGDVFVTDNNNIQKFDANGNFITRWGSPCGYGSGAGQFWGLGGVAVDMNGFVYTSEGYGNQRIQKFDSTGKFLGWWGGQSYPGQVAVGPDNAVYVNHRGNNSIQRMTVFSSGSDTLFEKDIPINQAAGVTQEYLTDLGLISPPGKLYLEATLRGSLGQPIATAEYPFYVTDSNISLSFKTDKKIYQPGEQVTIIGEIKNLSSVDMTDLRLDVNSRAEEQRTELIYTRSFNLLANAILPITIQTRVWAEGSPTIFSSVSQNNVVKVESVDQLIVAKPSLSVSLTAPDVVGHNQFDVNVEVKNTGKIDLNVQCLISDSRGHLIDKLQLSLPAEEATLLQYPQQISATTQYYVYISGDQGRILSKQVIFGEMVEIGLGLDGAAPEPPIYPAGRLSIPVTLTNTGQLDETLAVTYSLQSLQGPLGVQGFPGTVEAETRDYFLPVGGSLSDTINYDLAAGSYQMLAVASQPSASSQIYLSVVKENVAAITAEPGNPGIDGLIPVVVTVTNRGANTLNGSVSLAVVNVESKAVWRGEAQIRGLDPLTSTSVTIPVDPVGLSFGVYPLQAVFYSSNGQLLAETQTRIKTDGPVFEITTMPNHPVFTAGRDADLSFIVKNTGVRAGEMTLAVSALEVLRADCRETLQPGEEKTCQFTFVVPEETYEQEYPVDYVLSAPLAQGTKGNAVMQVAQPKAEVAATLDRNDYRNGETAELSLTITKQSATEDGTYVAIIRYGAYHDMQSFALTAQPATLTFRVPLAEITGENLFYGVHFESGREIKRQSLAFNQALPDLAARFDGQTPDGEPFIPEISQDNSVTMATTVTNYGQSASLATTLDLYDGDELLASRLVSALNPGVSESITTSWNVMGKGGSRQLRAVVDPQDKVTEFSEMNNIGTMDMSVPALSIVTDTDKDTYKIRQKVYITSTITNFMSTVLSELSIETTVEDMSGQVVYEQSTTLEPVSPSVNLRAADIWDTAGLPVDGTYAITQTIRSGSSVLAQGSKRITLEKAPDFTLSAVASAGKVKQGEMTSYAVTLDPLHGWHGAVTLSVERLPEGTAVTFDPATLLLPGQLQMVVTTTGSTEAGTHTIVIVAQGLDEDEIVNHKLPLTLDVSAFALETVAATQTVEQLNMATFQINSTSLNGYEGDVTLSVAGLPYGTRATLDTEHTAVPGSASLTVSTSKYAKPGTYSLTLTGEDGLVSHTLELGLIIQKSPALPAGIVTAPGPGPQNEDRIRSYNANLQLSGEFTAFGSRYGASTITADIDGDGYDEIIVAQGAGPGNTATLRAFARNGSMLTEHTVFEGRYGLTLAAGDMDGDWVDEVIVGTGPDPNAPGRLKVLSYNGRRFVEQVTQVIYPDMNFGLNIAVGDTDGDGLAEILTAPGPGPNNPAQISIWDYSVKGLVRQETFTAFTGGYGVNLAAGDIDGDGTDEILTGTGPDPKNSSQVRIYRGDGTMINEFAPYATSHSYGVTVTAGDLDENGRDEIITGPGPGPQNEPLVKVFSAEGLELRSVMAYPASTGYGVKVSAGTIGR